MPRIPYVERDQAPPEIAEFYAKMDARGTPVINMIKMAAHAPAILPHFAKMSGAILSKLKLQPKLREIAILRVAEILDCEYERTAHVKFSQQVGVTAQQIRDMAAWERSEAFDEIERAVLRFTDEVALTARVKNETFAGLAKYLDAGQLVELAHIIGFYGMLARVVIPFEVEVDTDTLTSPGQFTSQHRR